MVKLYRFVVIGAGAGIFDAHVKALRQTATQLVAVSNRTEAIGRARAEAQRCEYYADYRQMLAEVRPDVAVILTPHPTHAAIGIDCLNAGCHLLVEKPLAIQVSESDALIATAERVGRLIAVSFQSRARPEIRAARDLIQSGSVGKIQRVDMVSPWTRTRAYYRSSPWRGRWLGEGGGVLINQASHDLDLLCFLLGMPRRVFAWTRNLWHAIETEDTAHSLMEWDNNLLAYFQASTVEGWPALRRFDIVGTRGHLQILNGKLVFEKSEIDLRESLDTSPQTSAVPATHNQLLPLELTSQGDHTAVYHNLMAALNDMASLIADARSAAMSLELANGMTLSSQTNRPVEFPIDREEYRQLLARLQGA